MIQELEEFQKKFFKLFDELEEARPSLTGAAYERMAADILEQYKLEYDLINLRCSIPAKQERDKLQAQEARIVPQRWERKRRFLLFFKRTKAEQNYMADLVDEEADEDSERFFGEYRKSIAEKARAYAEVQAIEARAEAEENDREPAVESEPTNADEQSAPAESVSEAVEPPVENAEEEAERSPAPVEERKETPKERAMREFNKKNRKR